MHDYHHVRARSRSLAAPPREEGARPALSVEDALVGAVTVVQRSDASLRLNPHFHTLALDGVYVRDEHGVCASTSSARRARGGTAGGSMDA
jgi:hypothetical protein